MVITAVGQAALTAASAAPQDQTASQQNANAADTTENNGQDFTRPETLFQLRYLYLTKPGTGATEGTAREVTSDNVILRADYQFALAPQWKIALRADLPFDTKNPISNDNPTGNYLSGVGDADVQAAILHDFDARWAAGIGARLIAPTGDDNLTSGKWQAMPLAGFRYMLPEVSKGSYFIALARYDVSFAGDPAKKNISNLQLAPELNIALPNHWFFTFYPNPDIRINYGDAVTGQTGRLFLPFDVMLGRNLTKDVVASIEVSVPIIKDYPVYNFKTEARFNLKF
jgi:outer membrane putative beta-barrel porin/alpha-amylase